MSGLVTKCLIQGISKPLHIYKNGNLSPFLMFSRSLNSTKFMYQMSKPYKSQVLTTNFKHYLKLIGIGCGIGIIIAGNPLYDAYKKSKPVAILTSQTFGEEYILQELPPNQKLARSIRNPVDKSGLKMTLYQFQTCPFCCKVRAFLDYYGFSYDVVEVNSVTRIQTKWTKYRKVPFILIEQEGTEKILQLKDSTMIISALQSFISTKNEDLGNLIKAYPIIPSLDETGKETLYIANRYSILYGNDTAQPKEKIVEERQWRKWVDDVYVHMLSPNVYRTMEESFQAFEWFSKSGNWEELFSDWERLLSIYVGSVAMFFIGKRLKKRHRLSDDVRESFYNETHKWMKAVKFNGGKFHGGAEPDLSDLAVYGVLTAVEGCDAFQDLLANTKVKSWFVNMKKMVNSHTGEKYLNDRTSNKD